MTRARLATPLNFVVGEGRVKGRSAEEEEIRESGENANFTRRTPLSRFPAHASHNERISRVVRMEEDQEEEEEEHRVVRDLHGEKDEETERPENKKA